MVKEHPWATNEARNGPRSPRSAAASGTLLMPAPAKRRSLLGCLEMTGAAPKQHVGSSDGDTSIKLLSEKRDVVGSRVVSEAKRDGQLGLRRPCGLFRCRGWSTPLGAVEPRAASTLVALPLGKDGYRISSSP